MVNVTTDDMTDFVSLSPTGQGEPRRICGQWTGLGTLFYLQLLLLGHFSVRSDFWIKSLYTKETLRLVVGCCVWWWC